VWPTHGSRTDREQNDESQFYVPHIHLIYTWNDSSAFTSQPKNSIALLPVFIFHFVEGRRLEVASVAGNRRSVYARERSHSQY